MSSIDELEALMGTNDLNEEVNYYLDTGFAPLNKALSGSYRNGFASGRVIEMFGASGSGKTAIATCAMASAQRLGGVAAFNDHEYSFVSHHAANLGLDLTRRFRYNRPETYEKSIDDSVELMDKIRTKGLIAPNAPIIIVYDSLASMVPRSKMYDSDGKRKSAEDYGMHDNMALAKCTSATFPALVQMAGKYNAILLFLNQTRMKPGVMYGDPTTTPGGTAPEYYASTRIKLGRSMLKAKEGGDKVVKGQDITATITKNRVTAPWKTATWRFTYAEDGTGQFDTVHSTLEYMKEMGVLPTSGAYVEFEGKKYHMGPLAEKIRSENRLADLNDMLYALEK